jgi:hypothetical protein
MGCPEGDLGLKLFKSFLHIGYHIFIMPPEMVLEKLSYYAILIKLSIIVTMKMPFNDNAT